MDRAVFAVLAMLASPTLAEETRLNGMAEEVLASEWADPTYVDEDYLFEPIAFEQSPGQSRFLLDATPLAQIHDRFGGAAQVEEIFDNLPVHWLCYDIGATRVTFAATRIQGEGNDTVEPGPVVGVIIEEAHAPVNAACTSNAAAASPSPGNGIPGIGATVAELATRFGSAPVDAGGHLAYLSEAELGDGESWIESKTIYYRLEDGIVTGVAYRLSNADVAMSGFMHEAITGEFATDGLVEQRKTPRVGVIQTGALDVELEKTSIEDVVETYGGKVHERGEAGEYLLWTCYVVPDGVMWFYSDGEMGGGTVTAVGAQTGFAERTWGCAIAPHTLRYMQVDMPGTEVSKTELEATYGPATPDAQGRVGFSSEAPHPTRPGFTIWQDYVYHFGANGKVDAVAVIQMTGD